MLLLSATETDDASKYIAPPPDEVVEATFFLKFVQIIIH